VPLLNSALNPLTRKLPLPGIGKYTGPADLQLDGRGESPFGHIYYVNAVSMSTPLVWRNTLARFHQLILCWAGTVDHSLAT
jgi:hypothetical protein